MEYSLFDSHAHLDDKAFEEDRDELISSLPSYGVGCVVNPTYSRESMISVLALAEKYPFLYAAMGIHPENAEDWDPETEKILRENLQHPKVKAIGEIGLDYHYDHTDKELQKKAFRAQLAIARETGKKVIIHERDAWNDTIEILKDFPDVKGVFHCFSGSAEGAEYLLKRGFLISFTGVVTFKNARRAIEALKVIPIEKLMIETDSPYMAPVPYRGERNDPRKVIEVARKIAEVKEMTPEDVISKTYQNAVRFYGIEERE